MTQDTRYIYFFGDGQADGSGDLKQLIGGKGASLADMTRAGLNVPPGFTISAHCCDLYYKNDKRWPDDLENQVRAALTRLEKLAGRSFGHGDNPLLVAVRSGAAQSMPGMMDTVLNVGLNPDCVRGLAARTGNARGAWEAYRHFLVLFGHTVAGIDNALFDDLVKELLEKTNKASEADLDAAEMEKLCTLFLEAYKQHTGHDMPTQPWELLRRAIDAVFGSWNNERAILYRKHHGVDGLLGTAVNVQMMCPSEVSGVMFTVDPVNPANPNIIIESSYGLGEAVVLGKVTPDRFVLNKQDLSIRERQIADKKHVIATLAEGGRGQTGASTQSSLEDKQINELAKLGLRVEDYFKHPCDIEWGISAGKIYLLQARAIKGKAASPDQAEREAIRQEEVAALEARAEPAGTVWSRYNLSEILPEPTPMTWAIVRKFMSVEGGFGQMYVDLGFDPDPTLGEEGVFDLVCGRPYYNLSREPRMLYRRAPLEHPFAKLKEAPHKAIYPQPVPNPGKMGIGKFLFWLPVVAWQMMRTVSRCRRLSESFHKELREQIIPTFRAEVDKEKERDLSKLSDKELLQQLEHWQQRTLVDFARHSLKPTALAGQAMGKLEQILTKSLGPERARAALGELVMGVHPDADADLPTAIRELSAGKIDQQEFLKRFGHRGSLEMELAQPRWSEQPEAIEPLLHRESSGAAAKEHERVELEAAWQKVADEGKIAAVLRPGLLKELQGLHTYLALRETGKHYLMMGYALLRRILVELDRRHKLDGGIFYLTPAELPRLIGCEDFKPTIAKRRRRRELVLSLEAPQVIFSDDLETIGRPQTVQGAERLQGTPLSAGVAEGEALVLLEPTTEALPEQPFILVCPSTDPAWVPLFVRAKGLIMETGGVLSHGAIVAREFGLPAVAGISDVHRRIKPGQKLHLDGATGVVTVLE